MNKSFFDDKIKRFMQNNYDEKQDYKTILFRNVKEIQNINPEKTNPNHVITIWGLLYKKYRKTNYVHYIQVGKVFIKTVLPIWMTSIINTSFINYILSFFMCYCYVNLLIYCSEIIIDLEENKLCLSVLRENLVVEKHY